MAVTAPTESRYLVRRPGGRERSPHVLIVSYLFPPADVSSVRRAVAFRDAFKRLGVRTTVLTSAVSGAAPADRHSGIVRAGDLRERVGSQYQVLAGSKEGAVTRAAPRRWTRLFVPDVTALSWAPAAILRARGLVARDRPDAAFTSSPPESVHLVGLALGTLGIPWIADLRDGWTFEPPTPRPYARPLDRALERLVVRSAARVTAVTPQLVEYLERAYGLNGRVVHLTNGFDPERSARASDERSTLDESRFSLVYTGSGGMDGKDPRPFLRALARLLGEQPAFREQLEVVFAGTFTTEETDAMRADPLRGVVRVLGRVEHRRALGLQRAADGLLLITSVGVSHVATGKLYEYLAAERPMLALASGNAAEEIVARAGGHVTAPPDDEGAILEAVRRYVGTWVATRRRYVPDPRFDLGAYSLPRVACRLLDLFVEIGAFQRTESGRPGP